MTYTEIFIIGWNFNALMFVINLILAFKVISTVDRDKLSQESEELKELKTELDSYYPYRTYTTLLSYVIPFTASFRIIYKIIEMFIFLNKNQNARMFDYMVFKYKEDIIRARNK